MKRRDLIRLGVLTTATTLFAPASMLAAAGTANPLASPLAGSVFYTRERPGRWAGKEAGHTPTFKRSGATITVTTGHGMDGYVHYIVKHVILDEHFGFVRETMFDPAKDAPISRHDIGGLKNAVYALSLCNKHDAWVNVLGL